jgi:hypothetical protein
MVRSSSGTGDYLLTVDSSGGGETAELVDVNVAGGQWTAAFVALLEERDLGQGGYSIFDSTPADPNVTWGNIDRVRMAFDRPVSAALGDVTITGAATGVRTAASLETNGDVVTWILANPLPADRYTVSLSASLASALGGTPPLMQFSVLPGDLNGDNTVSLADLAVAHSSQFRGSTDLNFDPRADLDGNGTINFVDSIYLRNQIGTSLAAPSPSPSPAAAIVATAGSGRLAPSASAGALRAAPRRSLAAAAVDRLIVDSAEARTESGNAAQLPSASPVRRPAVHADRPAAARALSRLNLDAARPGDVS